MLIDPPSHKTDIKYVRTKKKDQTYIYISKVEKKNIKI